MRDNGYEGPSIMRPLSPLVAVLEAASAEDVALLMIALCRKARGEEDAAAAARILAQLEN